jgi:hypothetical protein
MKSTAPAGIHAAAFIRHGLVAAHATPAVGPGMSQVASDFSELPTRPARTFMLQAKRAVNTPGDSHEQEADRLAEQVMRMPEPVTRPAAAEVTRTPGIPLRRAVQAGPVDTGAAASTDTAPAIVDRTLAAPGQRLDSVTRGFMESRFGQDFSQVRVHTDDDAQASASAIGALAYASGSHVVFGTGQYSPHSHSGRQLLAHELAHVVQQRPAALSGKAGSHGAGTGLVQREPVDDAKPTRPALIKQREGPTDRIDDAYAKGSLDETHWRDLLAAARQEAKDGKTNEATRDYLILYTDLARLAQSDLVVGWSASIHVVTGSKSNCGDARPGLNFSLSSRDQWGANASTGFVDGSGKLGVPLVARGVPQPEVAIVLSMDVFQPDKEQSLGILRHEMIHAGHDADDASAFLHSSPSAKKGPVKTSDANSELLGYVEGFMTMFQLTHPAPTSLTHPAFVELGGVLDTGGGVHPWADADAGVRSKALGQLQEYYCHALDGPHREAFDLWVQTKSTEARLDQVVTGDLSPDVLEHMPDDDRALTILQHRQVKGVNLMGSKLRLDLKSVDFYHGLRGIIANRCKGLPNASLKL